MSVHLKSRNVDDNDDDNGDANDDDNDDEEEAESDDDNDACAVRSVSYSATNCRVLSSFL